MNENENEFDVIEETDLVDQAIDDSDEPALGNYHIIAVNLDALLDKFDEFYTKDETGYKWLVGPDKIKQFMIAFGNEQFKAGRGDAFDKVQGIVSPSMNKETIEALEFLINEK